MRAFFKLNNRFMNLFATPMNEEQSSCEMEKRLADSIRQNTAEMRFNTKRQVCGELTRTLGQLYPEHKPGILKMPYAKLISYMQQAWLSNHDRYSFTAEGVQALGFQSIQAQQIARWYWDFPERIASLYLALGSGLPERQAWNIAENI